MELNELRDQIDVINQQMQELFNKRMELSFKVAEYKIEHDMPVFQLVREQEILNAVEKNAPDGMGNASRVFFQTIMDISKCRQYQELFEADSIEEYKLLDFSKHCRTAVPGTVGSYSQMAADKMFPDYEAVFFEDFEDVFKAVNDGSCDFGILPIANSTAGSVSRTYELMKEYDFRICASTKVKVSHCLAAKKGTGADDIKIVYSHEQAISQCSEFLKKNGLKAHHYANTALAAEYVRTSDEPYDAIC